MLASRERQSWFRFCYAQPLVWREARNWTLSKSAWRHRQPWTPSQSVLSINNIELLEVWTNGSVQPFKVYTMKLLFVYGMCTEVSKSALFAVFQTYLSETIMYSCILDVRKLKPCVFVSVVNLQGFELRTAVRELKIWVDMIHRWRWN